MREETETIRTYYNANPRKEYLTHTEHLMIVSKKGFVTTADPVEEILPAGTGTDYGE